MRLPLVIIAVLLSVLVPLGFVTEEEPAGEEAATPVATIAERVEQLRGLRFRTPPVPVHVSAEQARSEGLADLDRRYPRARREADEALYTLLGLLPPATDLREEAASIFGDQVAGYYDPRTERLRIVEGTTVSRVGDEMIIAHELVHALEDQVVGLDMERLERSDDPAYAYTALVEGTATNVMNAYAGEHFDAETRLGSLLADSLVAPSTLDLPPFVVAQLLFPYLEGERFVEALYRETASWARVDVALRKNPPTSTEQILHPRKWLDGERPERVTVPDPGPGWTELTDGVFGEWQTGELLARGGRAQPEAAAGWGGDRYALYRRGGAAPCATPCHERDALVIRWVYDTAADSAAFAKALALYVDNELEPRPSAVATARTGLTVTLAIAPDAPTARTLARASY